MMALVVGKKGLVYDGKSHVIFLFKRKKYIPAKSHVTPLKNAKNGEGVCVLQNRKVKIYRVSREVRDKISLRVL